MYLLAFGIKTKSRLSGPLEKLPFAMGLYFMGIQQGPIDRARSTSIGVQQAIVGFKANTSRLNTGPTKKG